MAATAQTVVLSDGRSLGYAKFGSLTSAFPPILYFHGFSASRLEGALFANAARALGACIIAVDRPGMGLSTFKPKRAILEWPKDVLELADNLNIIQFHLLGVSGGCPYVLACLKEISPSRLLKAEIVSGLYPVSLGTQGMLQGAKAVLFLGAWLPSRLLSTLLEWKVGVLARAEDPQVFYDRMLKDMVPGLPAADLRCLRNEKSRKVFLEAVREGYRSGTEGIAWEGEGRGH